MYKEDTKIDPDLFSGFITAMFNFSEEIAGTSVKNISMGKMRLFYRTTSSLIVVLSASGDTKEKIINPYFSKIIDSFVIEGFEEKMIQDPSNLTIIKPFENFLDVIVSQDATQIDEVKAAKEAVVKQILEKVMMGEIDASAASNMIQGLWDDLEEDANKAKKFSETLTGVQKVMKNIVKDKTAIEALEKTRKELKTWSDKIAQHLSEALF
ncbi:MAG: hypothetical protein EAX96_15290 [Candidatus Lokiarchaeota archaeon]|nr:hypothetical protein [Candidatus Lokiarchaeota archaeon]